MPEKHYKLSFIENLWDMPEKHYKLSFIENLWYYLSVIVSFGLWYTVKVVIKKALNEKYAN